MNAPIPPSTLLNYLIQKQLSFLQLLGILKIRVVKASFRIEQYDWDVKMFLVSETQHSNLERSYDVLLEPIRADSVVDTPLYNTAARSIYSFAKWQFGMPNTESWLALGA